MNTPMINTFDDTFNSEPSNLNGYSHQRSELTQEIINRKPGFAEKWALLIFLSILLLLLTLTWFIRYPDTIEARAVLTNSNAQKEIITRQEGRLTKLFIKSNTYVEKGTMLGFIESTASHQEVIALSRALDSSIMFMSRHQTKPATILFSKIFYNLGEIQNSYKDFITGLELFKDYTVNGFYARKMDFLKKDIGSLQETKTSIEHQKSLVEQDLQMSGETYDMNKKLFEQNVLSPEEFRVEKSKFVNKQMALQHLQENVISNERLQRDQLKELDQLQHDAAQQEILFLQSLQLLKSQVDDWKIRYILEAPLSGTLDYTLPIQENQFIKQGQVIGYISPLQTKTYVQAILPQHNFGKIDTGLKVQLRFDAYPYQEAGFVTGTISYVSAVSSDSGYLATIRLDKGLETNNHLVIPYKGGLKAQAVVLIRNMRLLERFYNNTIKSFNVGK